MKYLKDSDTLLVWKLNIRLSLKNKGFLGKKDIFSYATPTYAGSPFMEFSYWYVIISCVSMTSTVITMSLLSPASFSSSLFHSIITT